MMKEENYDNLRRALDQLPDYTPPNLSWDRIDDGLNGEEARTNKPARPDSESDGVAKNLPSYSPPSTVWNQLNGELDRQRAKRNKLKLVYRWSARAAAAIVIFVAGYTFATFDQGPDVTYAYSEEEPSATLVNNDWNQEEESFQRVMDQLSAIDEPELNALRLELEELTQAKKEVEEMLRAYGNDRKVIHQLVEIENERSRVYRRAIAVI
ncbi:hypothetical protein CEQ90_12345 [Lewinellaceae bacterium SD302]|nr:hypothetical protein CEQ90_12345 [Lewinellaceae bacterium SD302]